MGQSINSSSPAGVIKQFGSTTVPSGFLNCDGSAISRTTYAILFAAIGTTYGNGNGTTTFNVPDFRGRMPMGDGTGPGLSGRTIGQNGLGTESHNLNSANLPVHTHGVSGSTSGGGISGTAASGIGSLDHTHTQNNLGGNIGGGGPVIGLYYNPIYGGDPGGYSNTNIPTQGVNSSLDHSHSVSGSAASHTFSATSGNGTGGTGANAGTGVNHINPATVVRYIIKY